MLPVHCMAARQIHQEEGWATGVGKSTSIQPNSRILIEKPQPAKPVRKKIVLILIFIYLQTYIFDLSIQQTWQLFVTVGQIQNLIILPIYPFWI